MQNISTRIRWLLKRSMNGAVSKRVCQLDTRTYARQHSLQCNGRMRKISLKYMFVTFIVFVIANWFQQLLQWIQYYVKAEFFIIYLGASSLCVPVCSMLAQIVDQHILRNLTQVSNWLSCNVCCISCLSARLRAVGLWTIF